jgi:hypothetical protein
MVKRASRTLIILTPLSLAGLSDPPTISTAVKFDSRKKYMNAEIYDREFCVIFDDA